MIQANELRIGNLVYEKHCDDSLHIAVVALIQKYGDATKIRTENGWYAEEPIPLTEEWLLKFGFERNENKTYDNYHDYSFNFFGVKITGEIFEFCSLSWEPELKYVHQLQNLYSALTGEELTV